MSGNTTLVEYGIQTEATHWRCHVCFGIKRMYVFKTAAALEMVRSGRFRSAPAFQEGIMTAKGVLVPPGRISGVIEKVPPSELMQRYWLPPTASESAKGSAAVMLTLAMIRRGFIPQMIIPEEIDHKGIQIKGADIIVNFHAIIQVKCDYRGGPRSYGGTGHLYLQTHECNPFGKH